MYKDQIIQFWKSINIFQEFEKIKEIFIEQKESSEELLNKYRDTIHIKKKGALLFCVFGGKLSEGINFKDELGRAVITIGLPFPNTNNLEIKLQMAHIDKMKNKYGNNFRLSSSSYYESLCFKLINQAIGRSIRHINDYAVILLIDFRYGEAKYISQIPKWIQKSIKTSGSILEEITNFFKFHSKEKL